MTVSLRGVSNTHCLLSLFSFFFNFQKYGSGGSVKRKIKKLWPNVYEKKADTVAFC